MKCPMCGKRDSLRIIKKKDLEAYTHLHSWQNKAGVLGCKSCDYVEVFR